MKPWRRRRRKPRRDLAAPAAGAGPGGHADGGDRRGRQLQLPRRPAGGQRTVRRQAGAFGPRADEPGGRTPGRTGRSRRRRAHGHHRLAWRRQRRPAGADFRRWPRLRNQAGLPGARRPRAAAAALRQRARAGAGAAGAGLCRRQHRRRAVAYLHPARTFGPVVPGQRTVRHPRGNGAGHRLRHPGAAVCVAAADGADDLAGHLLGQPRPAAHLRRNPGACARPAGADRTGPRAQGNPGPGEGGERTA